MFAASVLKVVIASPSDVSESRLAVERAIRYWNGLNAEALGVMLLAQGWENDASPAFGSDPQSVINSQIIENADALVGVFWTRLGSGTGRAASGTVEEIELVQRSGRPVLLYFSTQPVDPSTLDATQLQDLKTFRETMQREGLIATFESPGDLEHQLVGDLTRTIRKMIEDGVLTPAVGQPSDPGEAGMASRTSSHVAYPVRGVLRGIAIRTKAEWATLDDGMNIEAARYLMATVAENLGSVAEALAASELSELVERVAAIMKKGFALSRQQFYMDGGKSWKEFVAGVEDVIAGIEQLVDDWPQTA